MVEQRFRNFDGPGVAARPVGPGTVEFRNVSFAYDSGVPVLSRIDFTLAPGTTTALVGPSGSGKTTLAHLLLRFWDPTEGSILMNGHDLRDYTLDELRSQIALVSQDTYLFNASVRDNLILAKPRATESEFLEAVTVPACVMPAFAIASVAFASVPGRSSSSMVRSPKASASAPPQVLRTPGPPDRAPTDSQNPAQA